MHHNVHVAKSSLSLSSPVASPLALLDPYEMADSIRRTMTGTDAAVVAHIAAQSMSGNDFLRLSKKGLRKLSNNDARVFQELRGLQKISSDAIPSLSSPVLRVRDWRLPSIFPELTPLIQNHRLPDVPEAFSVKANYTDHHNDDAASSALLGPQNTEDVNYEAFDYGDDEIEHTLDLHATTIAEIAVPNHSLQPVLVKGPPLASTLEQIDSTPQNGDLATTPAKDGIIHGAEETHQAELQSSDESVDVDEASIYELDELHLLDPLDFQSAGGLHEDDTLLQSDCVVVGPDFRTPSTRSSSPSLSYVYEEDTNVPIQLMQMLLDDNVPNPQTTPDPNVLMEQDSPSNLLTCSLEPPQILINGSVPITEDEKALKPPRFPTSEPAATLSSLECSLLSLAPFLESLSDPSPNPINDTCFNLKRELNGQTYENLPNPNISEDAPDGAVHKVDLPRSNAGSKDPRDSSTSNDSHEYIESESCQSSSPPSPASSASPLDSEPSHGLLLDRLRSVDADVQTPVSSSNDHDETLEDVVDSDVSSTESPPWLSTPARLGDHHDLDFDEASQSELQLPQDTDDNLKQSNIDMNFLVIPTHVGAFTLPVDIIPVTPPGSPILEGLSRYMIFEGSEAPGSVLRVDQNNTSTPVQRDLSTGERTLWPPSEAPRFGLLLSNGNGQSLRRDFSQATFKSPGPGPNTDIAIDITCPDHLSHVQVRDSYLGMTSPPFERIQSGLLRVIPTSFALDREAIDWTTSDSATDRGLSENRHKGSHQRIANYSGPCAYQCIPLFP